MAKYFLGSVGTAEAFRRVGGTLKLMFRANTLTDSGINISSTQDEVRGGTGAPVVFTFNHDASVGLSLTDVLWKSEYLEAKLGDTFKNQGQTADYFDEEDALTADADGKLTLSKKPVTATTACDATSYIIMTSEVGSENWKMYEGTPEKVGDVYKIGGTNIFTVNHKYCVRYLANIDAAREMWVTSDILPMELHLVITAPLYAGDACNPSNGRTAGHITFEVPRFRLNPNLDLALAMSSNISISLDGVALAYTSGCNINGSKLMRIVECITGREWYDGIEAMYIDPAFKPAAGEYIPVYAVYDNGSITKLNTKSNLKYPMVDGQPAEGAVSVFTFSATNNTVSFTVSAADFPVKDGDSLSYSGTSVSIASDGANTGKLA